MESDNDGEQEMNDGDLISDEEDQLGREACRDRQMMRKKKENRFLEKETKGVGRRKDNG